MIILRCFFLLHSLLHLRFILQLSLYILNALVYSLGYVMAALFSWYLVSYISGKEKVSKYIAPTISVLCVIAVIPVIVSLFNHMYFGFDDGVYIRGYAYWFSQVYPIGILIADMVLVLLHSKKLGLHDTLTLLSYGILPVIAMLVQIKVYGITLLYIATTVSLLIIYILIHVEQSRRLQEQKTELVQANTANMLSQIQPHFLFNVLTSISSLCDIDPQRAKTATQDFALYLCGNIDSLKEKTPVPFTQELNHVKTYLALERMRFDERLNIE